MTESTTSQMTNQLKNIKFRELQNTILSKYVNEKNNLYFINSLGILPYLPKEIIEYIMTFLIEITDYIDYYIEKLYNLQEKKLDIEIVPYMLNLYNNPCVYKICQKWVYGEEFLLISDRNSEEYSFYQEDMSWIDSFILDFQLQVECISKPRNEIENKKLLEYLYPINKILRINYKCSMSGKPITWAQDLGPYFQKIINADIEEQNEILSIWNDDYVNCFRASLNDHNQGNIRYFYENPLENWKFICDFMMYNYH